MNLPTPYTVELKIPGGTTTDMYGNELPDEGEWRDAQAASWWVDKTDEKGEDSVLRTVDYLHVHLPPDQAITAASMIRLPDGTEWDIIGNPEDYRHGWHQFDPGLAVIHAKRVEG